MRSRDFGLGEVLLEAKMEDQAIPLGQGLSAGPIAAPASISSKRPSVSPNGLGDGLAFVVAGAEWRVERSGVLRGVGRDRLQDLLDRQFQLVGDLLGAR